MITKQKTIWEFYISVAHFFVWYTIFQTDKPTRSYKIHVSWFVIHQLSINGISFIESLLFSLCVNEYCFDLNSNLMHCKNCIQWRLWLKITHIQTRAIGPELWIHVQMKNNKIVWSLRLWAIRRVFVLSQNQE